MPTYELGVLLLPLCVAAPAVVVHDEGHRHQVAGVVVTGHVEPVGPGHGPHSRVINL